MNLDAMISHSSQVQPGYYLEVMDSIRNISPENQDVLTLSLLLNIAYVIF
jgi:hypothetical protein